MDKEFEDMCMKKRTKEIEPSVILIKNPIEIDKLVKSYKKLSEYFIIGSKDMIESKAPLLAILLGYFAMEQKAYEILALKGFKVTSHICAIKGISRIIQRKDLANMLSKAYENRLEVNYIGNIDTVETDRNRAKKFIEETVLLFISEIEKLILENN